MNISFDSTFKKIKKDFMRNKLQRKKLKISYATLCAGAVIAVVGLLSMKLLADSQSRVS